MNTPRPKNQSLSLNSNTFSVAQKHNTTVRAPKTENPFERASREVPQDSQKPSEPESSREPTSITDLVLSPSGKSTTAARPALYGWQGVLNRLSFGALKLAPSKDELMRRRGIETIQGSLPHPMTILVANAAGGAGKTITSIGLAGTFGVHRGGEVVVWDNNETQGSLALRTNSQGSSRTVVDLLKKVDNPEKISLGELAPFLRRQGSSRFEVLASSTDPTEMRQIGRQEFNTVHSLLSRFKQLMIVDSGNNSLAENFVAAAESADLLIIPTSLQRDGAQRALWTLRTLYESGYEELANNAIIVITEGSRLKESQQSVKEIRETFSRKLDVIDIPYDPHLDRGTVIDLELLNDKTRRAYENLAALVMVRLSSLAPKDTTN
nr:hypothetical protein [Thermococcus litoralis]